MLDGQPVLTLPSWVKRLGLPLWVSTPTGTICYLNARAEVLLGRSLDDCRGQPCREVIGGRTTDGAAFCAPHCPIRRAAEGSLELEPVRVSVVTADGVRREIIVVVIPLREGLLVHCVVGDGMERRLRGFMDRVRLRTANHSEEPAVRYGPLTPREREILSLLTEDATLHDIAQQLSVSYATVRNHVQHILAKLGAHSILEAVAIHLLEQERERN